MKHTKHGLRLVMLLMLTLALCLALASCGDCEHTYGEWTVKTAPTCTAAGERIRTCTQCEATESETVAATGHTEDRMVCRTCDTELVAIDSLVPTTLPSSDEARIEIRDMDLGTGTIDAMILNVYMTEEGVPFAHGTATVTDLYGETTEMQIFYDEGTVYATTTVTSDGIEVDTTVALFAEALIEAYVSDPTAMLDPETAAELAPYLAMAEELEVWLNEYVLPLLGDSLPALPSEPSEPSAPTVPSVDADALRTLIETYFTVKVTEDGATVTLDLAYFKELNATLSEMSLADVMDAMLGVGSTQMLFTQAPALLALDVGSLVEMIETNSGIDLSTCDEAADALMAVLYGEGATMEDVFGMSLSEMVQDDEVLATTVADLLCAALSTVEEPVTAADLTTALTALAAKLNDTLLYDVIETDREAIDAMIEAIDDMVSLVITVDADGNYVCCALTFKLEGSRLTATLYNDRMELTMRALMMPSSRITVTYTADKAPDPAALAAAKDGIVYAPITAKAIVDSGFTPVYADDGKTILGAICNELEDDMAYIDTEWGYASYGVYTVDLTATPVMVTCASYEDIVFVSYGFVATYTLYEFEFEAGAEVDITTLEPTSITPSQEIVTISVAPDIASGDLT